MNNVETLACYFKKILFLVIVGSQKKQLPTATVTSASEPPTVDTALVMMPTH